jgi:hypothetical protein
MNSDTLQVEDPLPEMLGTRSVSDFRVFEILEYLPLYIMKYFGNGTQV